MQPLFPGSTPYIIRYDTEIGEVEPGNETKRLPCKLTHGLALGTDGGGVVQNQDVSLELPAGQRVGARVDHHHALSDLVPADLWAQQERGQHGVIHVP